MRLPFGVFFVSMIVLVVYGAMIAAGIWALVTLNRIATATAAISRRLESIEQVLRKGFTIQS